MPYTELDAFGLPLTTTTSSVDAFGLTPEGLKTQKLQQRAIEKQNKLGITTSAEKLQQGLSDVVDAQVYTRDDGSKYTIQYQKGTDQFGNITANPVEVPYSNINKYGGYDTRNLYIDDTLEGNMKLGLARSDKGFTGRYTPGTDYGWAPGPKGVTVSDDALMDIELPYNTATQFEADIHRSQGQIAHRAATSETKALFGSGSTEYTTQEAPLWSGKDTDRFTKYDADSTYVMKEPKLRVTPGVSDDAAFLATLTEQRAGTNRLENLIDATQYGIGRKVAGISDTIVDAGLRLGKEVAKGITGKDEAWANKKLASKFKGTMFEDYIDEKGDFKGLDKYKEAVEYGYDDTRTQALMKDIGDKWDSKDWSGLALSTIEGVFTAGPEFFLESAGEFAIGALGKVGLVFNTADYNNQILEAREEITGQPADAAGRLYALAGATAMGLLNKAGADEMFGKTKLVNKALDAVAMTGSTSAVKQSLGFIANKVAIAGGKGVYEGAEEVLQEASTIIAERFGTKEQDEIWSSDSGKRLAQAFAGGFGAGAVGSASPAAVSGVIEASKNLDPLLNMLPGGDVDGESRKPLSEKATTAMSNIKNMFSSETIKGVVEGSIQLTETQLEELSTYEQDFITTLEEEAESLNTKAATQSDLDQRDELLTTAMELKMFHNKHVANEGSRPVLNNRPLSEIEKDLADAVASEDSTPDQIAELEAEVAVAQVLGYEGEQVSADDKDAIKARDAQMLKFYGGDIKGQRRTGLLEYTTVIADKESSPTMKEHATNQAQRFIDTQKSKVEAWAKAGREYKAGIAEGKSDSEATISFKYNKGKTAKKFHGNSHKQLGAMENELVLMQEVLNGVMTGKMEITADLTKSNPDIYEGVSEYAEAKEASGPIPKQPEQEAASEEVKQPEQDLKEDTKDEQETTEITTEEEVASETGPTARPEDTRSETGDKPSEVELTSEEQLEAEIESLIRENNEKLELLNKLDIEKADDAEAEYAKALGTKENRFVRLENKLKAIKKVANAEFSRLQKRADRLMPYQVKAVAKTIEKAAKKATAKIIKEKEEAISPKGIKKEKDEIRRLKNAADLARELEDKIKATKETIKVKKAELHESKASKSTGGQIINDMREWNVKNRTQAKTPGKPENSALEDTTIGDHFKSVVTNDKIVNIDTAIEEDIKTPYNDKSVKYLNKAKSIMARLDDAIGNLGADSKIHATTTALDVLDLSSTGESSQSGWQSISRLLMGSVVSTNKYGDVSMSDFKLHKHVRTAMSLGTMDWLANVAASNRAETRSDADVRRMLNLDSKAIVTIEDRAKVEMIDGTVPDAANKLGSIIFKHLGLKALPSDAEVNREQLQEHLKTELGLLALLGAESAGLIVLNKEKDLSKEGFHEGFQSRVQDLFGYKKGIKADQTISTFKLTSNENNAFQLDKDTATANGLINDNLPAIVEELHYTLGTERYSTGVFFNNKDNKTKEIRNEGVSGKVSKSTPPAQIKALKKQENTAYQFNPIFTTLYDKLVSKNGIDWLSGMFGAKNEDESHVVNRDAVRGKNLAIEDASMYMQQTRDALKAGGFQKMWAKWYVMTNGRFGIKSNTFNWQDKKLHRFAVERKKVDIVEGADSELMFKLGLAQAFDISVDKQTSNKSLIELNKLAKKLYKLVDTKDESAAFEYLVTQTGAKAEPEHALLGLAELLEYRKHKDSKSDQMFRSSMVLETDAITSGYILKLMQMPVYKDGADIDMIKVYEELERGGIFKYAEDSDGKMTNQTYEERAEDPASKDSYEKPAELFEDKIMLSRDVADDDKRIKTSKDKDGMRQKIVTGIDVSMKLLGQKIEGAIGSKDARISVSRSFMKNPFMVFNYGSAIASIIEHQKKASIENFYELLTEAHKGDVEALNTIKTAITSSAWLLPDGEGDKFKYAEDYANSLDGILADGQLLEEVIPADLVEAIKVQVGNTIKDPLTETFTENYGEFVEATTTINSMFALMFKAAEPQLLAALDKKLAVKNRGRKGLPAPLTEAEIDEVIYNMRKTLPVIELALSNKDDSLALLAKTEQGEYDIETRTNITPQAGIREADGRKRFSAQSKLFRLVESYTSGAVVPIHFLDGSIQSMVLSLFEAIGVHDANMFDASNAIPGTKAYNQSTAKLMRDYSLTTKMLESLNDTLNTLATVDINNINRSYVLSSMESSISIGLESAKQLLGYNNEQMKELKKEVEHEASKFATAFAYDAHSKETTKIVDEFEASMEAKGVNGSGLGTLMSEMVMEAAEGKGPQTIKGIYASMSKLQVSSEEGRFNLFNDNKMYIEHAALEGAGYVTKPEEYAKQVPANKLEGDIAKHVSKEKPASTDKQKDGIMADKENLAATALDEEWHKACKK